MRSHCKDEMRARDMSERTGSILQTRKTLKAEEEVRACASHAL